MSTYNALKGTEKEMEEKQQNFTITEKRKKKGMQHLYKRKHLHLIKFTL
jgi:hypothetical protein